MKKHGDFMNKISVCRSTKHTADNHTMGRDELGSLHSAFRLVWPSEVFHMKTQLDNIPNFEVISRFKNHASIVYLQYAKHWRTDLFVMISTGIFQLKIFGCHTYLGF